MGERRETRQWNNKRQKDAIISVLKTSRKIFTWAAVCSFLILLSIAGADASAAAAAAFDAVKNSYGNVIFRNIQPTQLKSRVLWFCNSFFVLNTAEYNVDIFSMAVYIAIESHRLYFHLANSKQLNYMWKYKVCMLYAICRWLYVCACMWLWCLRYVYGVFCSRWISHENKSEEEQKKRNVEYLYCNHCTLYTLFSYVQRSCDNFQIEAFG